MYLIYYDFKNVSNIRFLSLKETTCETRKNVSYFTSNALFVIKKIKF